MPTKKSTPKKRPAKKAAKKAAKQATKGAYKPAGRPTAKPAIKPPVKQTVKQGGASNREILESAGVINAGYNFSPQDSEAIEALSGEEVEVLIEVYDDLGEEFFERNANGIVF